jgi:CheY-like chemotaxis protein
MNMFTNAIKFTKESQTRRITVTVGSSYGRPATGPRKVPFIPLRSASSSCKDHAEKNCNTIYLQFAVEDTGRGLSEQELQVLFQRFGQANPKTYGKYGGSGLGLFISRELTELQGGQIGVHSEVDKGTIFFIYIRVQRYHATGASPKTSRRSSVSELLHDYKRQKSVGEPASTRATPPKEDESPFPPEMSPLHSPPPSSAHGTHDISQVYQLHVLVVEDNTINQRVLVQQLTREGCFVHTANHGGEALEFLLHSSRAATPATKLSVSTSGLGLSSSISTTSSLVESTHQVSIVLMDIEMPFMDGIECATRIRALEKDGILVGHLPIIAVTANVRQEHKNNAFKVGMDAVVTKPFHVKDLMITLKECIATVSIKEAGS